LIARILEEDSRASPAQRRAAFDNTGLAEPLRTLADKVASHAYEVTNETIAAAKGSGLRRGPDLRASGVCGGWSGHAAA
jgi:hypothetical protein